MTSTRTVKPANQRLRIALLRIFSAVVALPLILFTRSAWADHDAVFAVLRVLGVLLVVAGVLGRFWAILYIGAAKSRGVMQDGPYAVCRHPLYLFSTIGTLGLGLMLGSIVLTAFLGLSVFAILSATAAREERFLQAEFGPAYADYAARVPRILPRPFLYHSPATVLISIKALRSNFADALVFLSFIPLAELLNGIKAAGLVPGLALF